MGFTFQDLNDHELDIMEERLKEEDLNLFLILNVLDQYQDKNQLVILKVV